MSSSRVHQENLLRILNMLEKGRFISRGQAARLFECSEDSIIRNVIVMPYEHIEFII